jgi:polyphosphate kinase 2 (PPK2 family)
MIMTIRCRSTRRARQSTPDGRTTPYDERLDRADYEEQMYLLQVGLLKLQKWTLDTERKQVILFEGRDAAGKGGTIKRFTEHLGPRYVRVVALSKPSEREQGQWFFQRYIEHLPTRGEIVLFDRSWYNRAVGERVMGFASDEEYEQFMAQAPSFEAMLVESGVDLTKFWFRSANPSSGPGSSSGRSIRCGSGSCLRSTCTRWTGGRTTPTRRSRCSCAPTPTPTPRLGRR